MIESAHPPLRILLADDEPIVREALEGMLEALGMATTPVRDGAQALETFQANPDGFDLAFLDMSMPRMTGQEALRAMWRVRPDLPAILCSGYSDRDLAVPLVGLGPVAFLQKPFCLHDLSEAMVRALDPCRPSDIFKQSGQL